jgi:methylmalonyl-CoA/ethylmalonyl-CoA epimerase
MRIKGIHHLTLAVRDAEEARTTFEALFDAPGTARRPIPAFGVRATTVELGDGMIEFAAPVDADNPVRRFLERKGEGFYNVALEVDDLDSVVRELAEKGVRVSEPVESEPGVRSAFVTMTATHGLSVQLIELAEPAFDDSAAAPPETTVVESRPEHIPPTSEEQAETSEWKRPAPLDLTPDEWSDTD